MAAILGVNDLKQYALPAAWDAGRLELIRLESGETYAQLLSDIAAGLVIVNQKLRTNPLVAGLISITEEPALEYGTGTANGFQPHTEYGLPDVKRGKTTGTMLPLWSYDRMLGWTWDFLRKARRGQIDEDIASAMTDVENLWEQKVLNRLFKSTYDAVGSGKSVPLADGGTADSAYIPPNVPGRASAFAYTHSHLGNGALINQANLETAAAHLWEHGLDAPYELLVSQADVGSWQTIANVTGFVKRAAIGIRYGAQTDLVDQQGDYIGAVETAYGACNMRASARIPTTYWALYKSYGPLDQRNPLVVRASPQFGTGAVLLPGDTVREFPLEKAMLFSEFGVGVRNRVNAIVWYVNAGAYTSPTIS